MTAEPVKVDVYMPMFVGDFLRDTADLSPEEAGVYCRLLFHLWTRDGTLPLDHARLARMVGAERADWDRVWTSVGRFFKVADGQISQKRLSIELDKAKDKVRKASAAGKASAEARINGRCNERSTDVATPVATRPSTERQLEGQQNVNPPYPESESESDPKPEPTPVGGHARMRARTPAVVAPSQKPPNLHERTLSAFCCVWQEHYGEPYDPTPADKSQLGRLLNGLPASRAEELPASFQRYLEDKSPFAAQEKRHSLAWFCTDGGANKYRVSTPVLSAKEARGIAAGQQWLAHHRRKQADAGT